MANLCEEVFYACEYPLEVLRYFSPGKGSRYFKAEIEAVSKELGDDGEICGKNITLIAQNKDSELPFHVNRGTGRLRIEDPLSDGHVCSALFWDEIPLARRKFLKQGNLEKQTHFMSPSVLPRDIQNEWLGGCSEALNAPFCGIEATFEQLKSCFSNLRTGFYILKQTYTIPTNGNGGDKMTKNGV